MSHAHGAARLPWPQRHVGPRTDVRYMTRHELFRSAGWFLRAGCLLVAVTIPVALAAGVVRGAAAMNPVVMGTAFGLFVLTAMTFAGALYLDVRGATRSVGYNPAATWHVDHIEPGSERLSIELHDSEVVLARNEGADLVLVVDAYVHHSMGEPGRDAGTGWLHQVAMRFHGARPLVLPRPLPAILEDGTLEVAERRMENLLSLPVAPGGPVRFEARFTSGESLRIEADGLDIEFIGAGQCVEIVRP